VLATTAKTMEGKNFKVTHKVLKNSLHSQIWSDFEKVRERLIFFENEGQKNVTGKNQNSDELCSCALQELEQKIFDRGFAFKKNLITKPVGSFNI
jgi:hypothetical protein